MRLRSLMIKGFKSFADETVLHFDKDVIGVVGPNGAGKTTLINAICGVVVPNSGTITVDGYDVVKDYRQTRSMIGLVPQELQTILKNKIDEAN